MRSIPSLAKSAAGRAGRTKAPTLVARRIDSAARASAAGPLAFSPRCRAIAAPSSSRDSLSGGKHVSSCFRNGAPGSLAEAVAFPREATERNAIRPSGVKPSASLRTRATEAVASSPGWPARAGSSPAREEPRATSPARRLSACRRASSAPRRTPSPRGSNTAMRAPWRPPPPRRCTESAGGSRRTASTGSAPRHTQGSTRKRDIDERKRSRQEPIRPAPPSRGAGGSRPARRPAREAAARALPRPAGRRGPSCA